MYRSDDLLGANDFCFSHAPLNSYLTCMLWNYSHIVLQVINHQRIMSAYVLEKQGSETGLSLGCSSENENHPSCPDWLHLQIIIRSIKLPAGLGTFFRRLPLGTELQVGSQSVSASPTRDKWMFNNRGVTLTFIHWLRPPFLIVV